MYTIERLNDEGEWIEMHGPLATHADAYAFDPTMAARRRGRTASYVRPPIMRATRRDCSRARGEAV